MKKFPVWPFYLAGGLIIAIALIAIFPPITKYRTRSIAQFYYAIMGVGGGMIIGFVFGNLQNRKWFKKKQADEIEEDVLEVIRAADRISDKYRA